MQYKPIGKFSDDEKMLLNQSLKDGYVYINEAYTLLKKAKADTLEKVEAILGYTGKEDSYKSDKAKTISNADKGNANKDKSMLFFSMAQDPRIASFDRNKNIQSYDKNNGGALDSFDLHPEEPTPIFKSNIYINK